MREMAINIMGLYYQAKISRAYRFPAELVQAIAQQAHTDVSMVELVLESNGVCM